ncbi:ImmA/IrrE family metallo-endopeptidase [Wohlfahrtiimonas sp. G9077]|uniref:ImmA/IrrE family metallo-endopeptidase n=1 Tax=Wohlfahrtiimonas sp. G9077 TaxID=1980118 RepID=UPI000B9970C3|nr:ImmA/IrrE family metallo-endopeptidase [Wohlfahrtiimonas sp. G9077]OYQ75513.1 hypothetical protein B9T20_02090 [Wohlfahrtiimonas sp. G9077]
MQRELSIRVSPMSAAKIGELAKSVRKVFKINKPFVDLEDLMEKFICNDMLEICLPDDIRLKGKYALTYPDRNKILLSESTYNAACFGDGRARFTVAHEIGHLVMHKEQSAFARSSGNHKIYEDAEWQADTFASSFLMDVDYCNSETQIGEVRDMFGVSWQAASIWHKKHIK